MQEGGVEEDDEDGEEQAVHAVEDAAMLRYDGTAVFHSCAAFQQRFGKVADGGGNGDEYAQDDRVIPGNPKGMVEDGGQDDGKDQRRNHCEDESAEEAL